MKGYFFIGGSNRVLEEGDISSRALGFRGRREGSGCWFSFYVCFLRTELRKNQEGNWP